MHNDIICLDKDDCEFRKRALRDSCLFIGWFKIISVALYISMYYLLRFNAKGEFVFVLQICLLCAMAPSVILGVLLCDGAYNENACSVCAAFCISLFLATYDLIIGVLGVVYIMIIASNFYHVLMTLAFVLLALTSIPAYCHDAFIINSYRKFLDLPGTCF